MDDNINEFYINAKVAREKSMEWRDNKIKAELDDVFTKIHSAIQKGKKEIFFPPTYESFDWELIERKLIECYYTKNMKIKDLASEFNLSESNVKQKLFRARKTITYLSKKELEKYEE